jgi:hypothetical protein
MNTGELIAVIVGAVLIVAGIVLVILTVSNVLRGTEERLQPGPAEEASWPDVVKAFIEWLKETLPKKLVPGFAMIIIGAAIIIAALVFVNDDNESEGDAEPTPAAVIAV